MTAPLSHSHLVILFDGVCNTCNRLVDFLLRHDKGDRFRFASLQSQPAQMLLMKINNPQQRELARGLHTVVAIDGRDVWVQSAALFRIAQELPWPWQALKWLRLLPKGVSEAAYGLFARNRYQLFGRREACRLPTAAEQKKFL